uniref:Uncharacterized protein n=1 Tax=Panagrellus redivivus TaxID=6233 RepID=A0A7E4VDG2_PANRE
MLKTVLVCALLAGTFATDANDTTGAVKNETASGTFYPYSQQPQGYPQPNGPYARPSGFAAPQPQQTPYAQPAFIQQQPYPQQPAYGPVQYPAYPPQPQYSTPFWAPKLPINDDFICDTEATILVVTNAQEEDTPAASPGNNANNGGYGNNVASSPGLTNGPYGPVNPPVAFNAPANPVAQPNADRLKCSVVATADAHSCNVCCQLAARHDHSISQNDIKGFIVDDNQVDHTQAENNNNIRAKRDASSYGASSLNDLPQPQASSPGTGGNICVCCAPRRQVNTVPQFFQQQFQQPQQFVGAFSPPARPY